MGDRRSLGSGRCVELIVSFVYAHLTSWQGVVLLTGSANMDDFISRWKTLNFPKDHIMNNV